MYTSLARAWILHSEAAKRIAARNGRRDADQDFGTNPCSKSSEVGRRLQSVEAIVRENDTLATLKKKVETATIFGTLQATLTDFRYVASGARTLRRRHCSVSA